MKKISLEQVNLNNIREKLIPYLSTISFTGNWEDLETKPMSLNADGGNTSFLSGYSADDFIKKYEEIYFINNSLPLLSLYVDTVNGEDMDVNGNAVSPYRTISYALSQLPKYITSNIEINVICNSTNHTIIDNLDIIGFYGPGGITIQSLQNDSDFNSFDNLKDRLMLNLSGDHTIAFNSLNQGITFNKFRLTRTNSPIKIIKNLSTICFKNIYMLDKSNIVDFECVKNTFIEFNNVYMEGNTNSHITLIDNVHCSFIDSKFGFCNKVIENIRNGIYKTNVIFESVNNEF